MKRAVGGVLAAALAASTAWAAAPLTGPRPTPRPALEATAAGRAVALAAAPLEWSRVGGRPAAALVLTADDPDFGGISGLAVSADGGAAWLLGDRGALYALRLRRRAGRLSGADAMRRLPLAAPLGDRRASTAWDAEDLAGRPGPGVVISLEGPSRLWRYGGDGLAWAEPGAPGFAALQRNSGLEAAARDAAGALYAIPERSGALERPFPVFRRDAAGAWSAGRLTRRPPHLVTGAAFGPDGALYVLERALGLTGLAWRLSRVDPADWPDLAPRTLVSVAGGLDNMEGAALWRDADGALRALLVSDDNFNPLQRTLLVEVILDD